MLLIPLLAVQAAVTFAIVPHAKLVAFLAGKTAMTVAGASANWYFTGESRPGPVPAARHRSAGVGHHRRGAGLRRHRRPAAVRPRAARRLPAALLLSSAVIFRGQALDLRAAARWPRIRRSLLDQRHGVVANGLLAAYVPAVALAIIALFSPVLLPMFVLADRLGKFVAMAVSPLLQMFQGWVPAASGLERVRRMLLAYPRRRPHRDRGRVHGVPALVQPAAHPRAGRVFTVAAAGSV